MTSLRHARRLLASSAALAALASTAQAQVTYDFSANLLGANGGSNGLWTGNVTFNWLTFGGSGSGVAASIITTAVPAGVGSAAQGVNALLWSAIGQNNFTVTSGVVTSFQFIATSSPDNFHMCMNSTLTGLTAPSGFICPANYNRVGVINGPRAENFGGLQGISFQARPTTVVPEPSTYALIGTGLAGLALVRRRRAARA
jgi:hypothetical protein